MEAVLLESVSVASVQPGVALPADSPGAPGAAGEPDEGEAGVRPGPVVLTAEQGLKHLLLTVDVERLYR